MAPDLTPLELLHPPGDPEHTVSFARRRWMPLGWPIDGQGRRVRGAINKAVGQHEPGWLFEPLWNVRARDLREVLPQIREQLVEDVAFSICGFIVPRRVERASAEGKPKRLGRYRRSATRVLMDGQSRYLPRAYRRQRGVRALTAAWADLDFYKLGLTQTRVLDELEALQRRGELPLVSMFLFSGRGVWPFWVLRDKDDPQRSVRAGADNVRARSHIQQAVHLKLAHLGSDAAALDLSHMARVPGSVRTDLGDDQVPIRWQIQSAAGSQGAITYTLDELRSFFGIETKATLQVVAKVEDLDPATRRAKQRGARGRYFTLLLQLDRLEAMRGGWKIGTRGRAIWLQVAAVVSVRKWCRKLGDAADQPAPMRVISELSDDAVLRRAFGIAERCEPSVDFHAQSEARAAWKRALHDGGLGCKRTHGVPASYATIAEWLDVTPEETEQLRKHGFKNPLPPASRFRAEEPPEAALKVGRGERAHSRRECLRQIEAQRVGTGARWYGLRTIRRLLRERGHTATLRTIAQDLEALGIENPNGAEAAARARASGAAPFEAA